MTDPTLGPGTAALAQRADGLHGHAFDSRMFIRLEQLKHERARGVLDERLRMSLG